MTHRLSIFAVAMLSASVAIAPAAFAQTFTQTLKSSIQTSPTVEANRSALRATEEGVIQAGSGRGLQATANAGARLSANDRTDWDTNDTYTADISASLLLYDGGRTQNAVESARAQVDAARAGFSSVIQSTLLNAVTAFVDVRRDGNFVRLARNNVRVINQQVAAARDRFEVGEVTRTDVSQAEARLAAARSNLASNEGGLERSKQNFLAIVGIPATNLSSPPSLPRLPKSVAEAEQIATREHPDLAAARANIRASEFDLLRAKSGRMPTLSLGGQVQYSVNTIVDGEDDTSANLSLNGSVPIATGGETASLIRQAQNNVNRRKSELQGQARTIKQNVALSWANLSVARASIRASQQEIRAARLAFEGVREEAKLGARTTLDVLDAEQDVLDAESNLVAARRDEYVAAYNLIFSMGLLSPEFLSLGMSTLDMEAGGSAVPLTRRGSAVERIRNRWN